MGHLIVPEAEALLDKEIPVLDRGFVRLVDYMGGDARIVQTARVSYGEGTRTAREDAALIDYLFRNRHTSPFEHVILEIHCKLPIFVARQWIRHRTARINELSGRYSVMTDEFYLPPKEEIRLQSTDNKQGRSEQETPPELQQRVLEILKRDQTSAYASYEDLLHDDVARELARINLPLSLYTQWYWQMDLHNLLHFLALRLDPHAQWEIRKYAEALLVLTRAVAPRTVESFERHELNGCRLSEDELGAVRRLLNGQSNPLTGRRLTEFNAKVFAGAPPPAVPAPAHATPRPHAHKAASPTPEPTVNLSRDDINLLPLRSYEGPIRVISDAAGLTDALAALKSETLLGFDTETQPSFTKGETHPPALLQLAGEREVFIFQLQALPDPGPVMALLANRSIIKAGVAHTRDVQDLARMHPFTAAGFVDLAEMSSRAGIANNGLRGIAAAVLGFRMSKGAQRSNWARKVLSETQLRYAATDAWVGREIYLALTRK